MTAPKRNPPTALGQAPLDHALLALQMVANVTSILRLGYCLPEADYKALLDEIERDITRIVLKHLRH